MVQHAIESDESMYESASRSLRAALRACGAEGAVGDMEGYTHAGMQAVTIEHRRQRADREAVVSNFGVEKLTAARAAHPTATEWRFLTFVGVHDGTMIENTAFYCR